MITQELKADLDALKVENLELKAFKESVSRHYQRDMHSHGDKKTTNWTTKESQFLTQMEAEQAPAFLKASLVDPEGLCEEKEEGEEIKLAAERSL